MSNGRPPQWAPPTGGAVTEELRLSLRRERFRLRYALAAASVHEALAREADSERAVALLVEANAALGKAIGDGDSIVTRLVRVDDELARSVRTFLADIMLPSMHVLRAGVVLELRQLRASIVDYSDEDANEFQKVATGRRLSWRVRYNLACYYASFDQPREAFRHLQDALAEAPSAEVVGLASWAGRDPSLARLHAGEWLVRTQRLLSRFAGKPVAPPSSVADLDGVGPLGAEQLARLGIDAPSDLANAGPWGALAEAMDAPVRLVLHWLGVVDLAAVAPLRTTDVNALIRAGTGTTAALAAADTRELLPRLKALGDRASAGWTPPTETELDHWIMAARRHLTSESSS